MTTQKAQKPITLDPLTPQQREAVTELLQGPFSIVDARDDGDYITAARPTSKPARKQLKTLRRTLWDTQDLVSKWQQTGRPRAEVSWESSDKDWPHVFRIRLSGALASLVLRIAKHKSQITIRRGPDTEGIELYCEWESTAQSLAEDAEALQRYADAFRTGRERKEGRKRKEEQRERVLAGEEPVTIERGPHSVTISPKEASGGRLGRHVEAHSDALDYTHETRHFSAEEALVQAETMLSEMEARMSEYIPSRDHLAYRARELFDEAGDTQTDLGDAIDSPQPEVSRALQGQNVKVAKRIVEHYTGKRVEAGFVLRD